MQSISDSVDHPSNSASSMDSSAPNNDFKMTSLGEVQRIIGLSLSKIQLGRNQRGGLPLHKNLLVATVLNKARDLYMQETMYMNYKMMTGQFAAAASAANHQGVGSQMMGLGGQHQSPYPSHAAYHYHAASNHSNDGACEEDLEPQAEANDADYDEDSESDVEDECDNTTSARVVTPNPVAGMSPYHHSVMTSMQNTSSVIQASQIQQQAQASSQVSPLHQAGFLHHQQQQHQPPHPQSVSQVQQPHSSSSSSSSSNSNDEGFIDEPDCDCDARNFSTSESRVPFQYCYHCAPFHPSNGRGPTLVPSPCSASLPSSPSSVTATLSTTSSSAATASSTVTSSTVTSSDFEVSKPSSTFYDMDSQPCGSDESEHQEEEVNGLRGTKRGRSQSLDASSTDEDSEEPESQAKRKRRESEEEELSSPETSQDESGYQSDSSHHEMFHPAFRGATPVTASSVTSPTTEGSGAAPGQTMEIDQITSLVSIFSFVQHNMAAAAAANNRTSTTTTTDSRKSEDEEDKKGEGGGGGHSPSSEDSDSESDTSSDSGHSSDDHEAAKEEELSTPVAASTTTTTTSTAPSDLCATSVASVVVASEAPPCVEVASL